MIVPGTIALSPSALGPFALRSIAPARPAAISRRVSCSSQTLANSVTRASDVNTEATANEPGLLYSWNSFSTRSGIVSVRPAMWPETT